MKKLLLPILGISLVASPLQALTFWWKPYKPQQTRREIIYKKAKSIFAHRVTISTVSATLGAAAVLLLQKHAGIPRAKQVGLNS